MMTTKDKPITTKVHSKSRTDEMSVIAIGNPESGFQYIGPFTENDAYAWAYRELKDEDEPWCIIELFSVMSGVRMHTQE